MDPKQQDIKKFYEEQLRWSREQASIIDEIDSKLHEMKSIAEFALGRELSTDEVERLNNQMNELKEEVHQLEKKLQTIVH